MNITVTWGIGHGLTSLAAFDSALCDAGIGNYNIVPISSIIPPGALIQVKKYVPNETECGYRMYTVLAQGTSVGRSEVWAGLGWMTDSETGRGIFVEHTGDSEDTVKQLIEDSLESMRARRKNLDSGICSKIVGIRNQQEQETICAVVCAVYETEPWQDV